MKRSGTLGSIARRIFKARETGDSLDVRNVCRPFHGLLILLDCPSRAQAWATYLSTLTHYLEV
ncbi:MAG: hypothetical protein HY231_05665 [Acidobacteria bacterium]|nr:hypothetical protein [Acidobacteriota bacterium]